jgi:HAD superfamily hydrolase (TIGR01509 family)
MLTEQKSLSKDVHNIVWKLKQEKTISIIDNFSPDFRIKDILRRLKDADYLVGCCTNSIRETAKLQLIRKGFMEHIDFFFSNQDVNKPKPHPEMYMKCMLAAGVSPKETLIIEDSHHGRKGAIESGGHLCAVTDCEDVTFEKITEHLEKYNSKKIIPKWQGGKMNVLIPMAGAGSRFQTFN